MPQDARPAVPLLDALRDGVITADGGMGTRIYEAGVVFSANYEELCLSRPDLIRRVHEDFVSAGAQLIETNTFGANSVRLARHGLDDKVRDINAAAVRIAREAGGTKAYVAGAIGPSGLLLDELVDKAPQLREAFRAQAEALAEASVDAIVVETMRQPMEMWIALDAVREATRGSTIALIAQVSIDDDLAMADGTPILAMAEQIKACGADVIGVNCSTGPQDVFAAVEKIIGLGVPISAMPNAGLPRRVDDRLMYVATPEYFGLAARRMFKLGVRIVGGCCGTTPDHIRRIANAARMAGGSHGEPESASVAVSASAAPAAAGIRMVPAAEKSAFARKIASGRFVVSVEVNPPVGLAIDRQLDAAKMLAKAGVDVINIADGARAQARMSNLALAVRMQTEIGVETMLHVCGRDRNLLGQVAHLMGAHALGIKNLVVITGDPPKLGDFPDMTAVYDLDSIGILRLVSNLNRGIAPGGKPIGQATSFFSATGAEPAASNFEREMTRLRQKIAAGAELVMTQPVYDIGVLDHFLTLVAPLGIPVLVGILPLASSRNAEFLHNEVPGMQIPDAVRERMRKAGSGPAARKEGIAIAREMLASVRSRVAGAYVMPPLDRHEVALDVLDGFLAPLAETSITPNERRR
jgi:methionine synthase / methylenetetrahydrofolate reductase(NADPH)